MIMAAPPATSAPAPPLRVGGLFSTGRAGSTWLGAIVSTHPEVAYRFEPFHRLQRRERVMGEWAARMKAGRIGADDVAALQTALLPAHVETEKPPFFAKSYRVRTRLGQPLLWRVAKRAQRVGGLYRQLYSPRSAPPVIFKEVDADSVLQALALHTTIPLVYLVRHPCAVVWSMCRGQAAQLMPDGRHAGLAAALRDHDASLHVEWAPRLEQATAAERNALLWRVDVERALRAVPPGRGLHVVYERLCAEPEAETVRVFHHFGLEPVDATWRFVYASRSGRAARRVSQSEAGINRYFSVYRDSGSVAAAWKRDMPAADREATLAIVRNSPAYTTFADQWELE